MSQGRAPECASSTVMHRKVRNAGNIASSRMPLLSKIKKIIVPSKIANSIRSMVLRIHILTVSDSDVINVVPKHLQPSYSM